MFKEDVVLDQSLLDDEFHSLQQISLEELVLTKNIELEMHQLEDYFSMTSSQMTEEQQHQLRHRCFKYLRQKDKYGHGAFLRKLLQFPFFKLPMHRLLDQLLLKKVNFSFLGMGDKGMLALAECLKINQRIRHLILKENQIGPLGANALFAALQKNTSLEYLDLSYNRIGISSEEITFGMANVLLDTFKDNKTLLILHLSHNKLTDIQIAPLIDSLAENYALEEMDLSGNELSAKSADLLSQFFTATTSVKRVNLEWNALLSSEIQKVISSLQSTSLRVLNLNWCSVCDKGAKELAAALRNNQTLEEIYLSNNKITKEGGKEIGPAWKDNSALMILDLSNNCLEWEGVKPILENANHKHLQELHLIHTQIDGTEVMEQVKQVMEQISSSGGCLQVFFTAKKGIPQTEEVEETFVESNTDDEEMRQEEALLEEMEKHEEL